jgi:type IV secretory pathway VirB2 component (pilin)
MRVLGLAVAGILTLSASTAGHATPSAQSMKQLLSGRAPLAYEAAVVGVCIRCAIIVAAGEANGSFRVAHRTIVTCDEPLRVKGARALGKGPLRAWRPYGGLY